MRWTNPWPSFGSRLKRFSDGLLTGGLDAARWIERESVFSLEARAGTGTGFALALLSLVQTPTGAGTPVAAPAGPAEAFMHAACLVGSLVGGSFLGAVFRNAWNLFGALVPRARRSRVPRWGRVAAAVGWTLFFHAASLMADMSARPALYQTAFYDHGGWLAAFQVFVTDKCPWWTLGFFRTMTLVVAGLAVAEWARRLAAWFNRFPLPLRLGYAVVSGGMALAALGVWSVMRFQALRNQGPNLLVLAVGGLRSDLLEQGSSGKRLAPKMNEFASVARTYARCVTPLAAEIPALTTFWTGRTPLTHGVRHSFPSAEDLRLGPDALPAVLRRQGYFTVALADAGGDFFTRLAPEFDRVAAADQGAASSVQIRALRRYCHLWPYLSSGAARRLIPALRNMPEMSDPALLAQEADDCLKRLRFQKKFCLTVFFSALLPPQAISSDRALELLDPAYRGPWKYRARGSRGEETRRRALYEANARAVDEAVGGVLASLKKWHLDENTVVALWSPYGQSFDEEDRGPLRGWETLAAPFAVLEPRRRTPPRWISEPVRAYDTAPTLLDVLGLPIPESMEGFSLKQRDFGEPPDEFFLAYAETDVVSAGAAETSGGPAPSYPLLEKMLEEDRLSPGRRRVPAGWEDHVLIAKQRMVQLQTHRLLYIPTPQGVRFELYDFANDPTGIQDLSRRREHEEKLQELKEMLFRFLAREDGWRPQNGFWIPEAFLEP